jgi:hypothetical protein
MEAGDLEMDENGMAPPSGRPSGRPPARPPTVSWAGRYLEDFTAGDVYRHPLGRTVMEVDAVCRPAAVGQAGDGGGCRLGRRAVRVDEEMIDKPRLALARRIAGAAQRSAAE